MARNVNENEMVSNLIDAIDTGSSIDIQSSFNEIMANKISVAIDAFRNEVAGNLFQIQESNNLEQIEEGLFYDGSDMLGEGRERKSDSYSFTHHPGDEESEKKLADLKASVKGTGKRVVLQGRLGKNSPHAEKYKQLAKDKKNSPWGARAYQRIAKADASHHDVYVYNK